jgi:hypothetical protein
MQQTELRTVSAVDALAAAIRELILDGEMLPGERLRELSDTALVDRRSAPRRSSCAFWGCLRIAPTAASGSLNSTPTASRTSTAFDEP